MTFFNYGLLICKFPAGALEKGEEKYFSEKFSLLTVGKGPPLETGVNYVSGDLFSDKH